MNSDTRRTLEALKSGEITVDEAMLAIKKEPFADIGYAKVDLHRGIRQGAAEVIYGAGKTAAQMIGILGVMLKNGVKTILITRLSPESAAKIQEVYPALDYRAGEHIGIYGEMPEPTGLGKIVVATGGTSDIPVAEEAALTAEVHGNGASFGGVSALLSMLNSCASGVSVVNIDNGFGAGYLASMINHIGGTK